MNKDTGNGPEPGKSRRKENGKRKKRQAWPLAGCVVLLLAAVFAAGAALYAVRQSEEAAAGIDRAGVPAEGETILADGTAEGTAAQDEVPGTVPVSGEAVGEAALTETGEAELNVESCMILPDTEQFALRGVALGLPESDDDRFYLIQLETYEEEIPEDAEPIASTEKKNSFVLIADVKEFEEDSALYDKYVVAVKREGKYVAVTTPRYITNPEALADYSEPYPETESIKGLLVDPQKLGTTELDELGIKHAIYNIPVARLLGSSTSENYPTLTYTYNGKDYTLNGHVVNEYDYVFSTLSQKGIVITAILLNNKSASYMNMIHPLSRDGNAYYYAFNAAEEEGCEYLEAIAAFLAERYRDEEHGVVMNWIVGNEVNVRSLWNYMQYVDLETYAREYARAFRLIYNGIKSMNANARVYISLDQQWKKDLSSESSYNSRDFLDVFNECIKEEGNIDWGLAHHPYSVPITWPKFWELSAQNESLVVQSEDTSMVTIYNIGVVTDYMQHADFLTDDGEVRSVILSEMGFTSTYGEDVQAVAFAYAYLIAENNPYIDAMILSRETDAAEEVAQGLALGLSYQNGRKKYIYDVFRYIDTEASEEYTEFARNYIGIGDWSEVIETE